jgi:hypothetical protein
MISEMLWRICVSFNLFVLITPINMERNIIFFDLYFNIHKVEIQIARRYDGMILHKSFVSFPMMPQINLQEFISVCEKSPANQPFYQFCSRIGKRTAEPIIPSLCLVNSGNLYRHSAAFAQCRKIASSIMSGIRLILKFVLTINNIHSDL